jgi:hypothetical protein
LNRQIKGCQAGNPSTVEQQDRFPGGLTESGAIHDFSHEKVNTGIAVDQKVSASNLWSRGGGTEQTRENRCNHDEAKHLNAILPSSRSTSGGCPMAIPRL